MNAMFNGRPAAFLKTNDAPERWVAYYLDIVWNGGWFLVPNEQVPAEVKVSRELSDLEMAAKGLSVKNSQPEQSGGGQ